MRISYIAWGRITHHKNEALLSVFAITLTVMASSVVFTTLDLFNESIQNYYRPMESYNMILERHGSLVQFFPLDSFFNDSIVGTIDHDLHVNVYPVSFEILEETIQAVIPNVLVGVSTPVLDDMIAGQQLDGRIPQPGSFEVVTGRSIQRLSNNPVIGENVTLFNTNFTIVGTVPFDNPFMDNFIFTTYEVMQSALRLNGTCNVLFVKRVNQADEAYLEGEIESRYPGLKFITSAEVDVLSSDVVMDASSWNGFLLVFTLFICISFPLTTFFINHDKIHKEITLLRLIGTPRLKILLYKCQEHTVLFVIGAILGTVLTMFIFPLFTNMAFMLQGVEYDAWGLYQYTFYDIQPNVLDGFVTLTSALLGIAPVVLLLPYIVTIWRVERVFTAGKRE